MGPGCVWPSGYARRCWPRRWSLAWTPARLRWAKSWPLRSLLLNLHFRAEKGEPVTEAEMRGLIERADGSKMQRADAERMVSLYNQVAMATSFFSVVQILWPWCSLVR